MPTIREEMVINAGGKSDTLAKITNAVKDFTPATKKQMVGVGVTALLASVITYGITKIGKKKEPKA